MSDDFLTDVSFLVDIGHGAGVQSAFSLRQTPQITCFPALPDHFRRLCALPFSLPVGAIRQSMLNMTLEISPMQEISRAGTFGMPEPPHRQQILP